MSPDPSQLLQAADPPSATGTEAEQRARNREAFKAKYDAMLNIADFIANFRSPFAASRPDKPDALKAAVADARKRLRG